MKKYFKDFAVEGNSLVGSCDELQGVIINRHEKYATTVEYKEVHDELYELIRKLRDLLPEDKKTIMGLEETMTALENICYSAAYRDGMSDLMAAMTFNKLGITMVEYCGTSNKSA